jgi:hypothetical protein
MIRFHLGFINPFPYEDFISFYSWSGRISKNKSWEVQISHYAQEWLSGNLQLDWAGRDHAGPAIEFNLFGYTISANIYDNRHWDYEYKHWEENDKEDLL